MSYKISELLSTQLKFIKVTAQIFGVIPVRSYVINLQTYQIPKALKSHESGWPEQIYVVSMWLHITEFVFIIIVNNIQKEENYSCKFEHIKGETHLNQLPFIIYHDTVFNDMITYPYLIKCAECTVINRRLFYSREKSTFCYSTG